MKFKKTIYLLVAISLLAVLLVACADTTPTGQGEDSGNPSAGAANQTTADRNQNTETPDTSAFNDETNATVVPVTAEELLETVRLALVEIKRDPQCTVITDHIEYLRNTVTAADNVGLVREIRAYSGYDLYKADFTKPYGYLAAFSIIEIEFNNGNVELYRLPVDGNEPIHGKTAMEISEIMRSAETVEELNREIAAVDSEKTVRSITVMSSNTADAVEVKSGNIELLAKITVKYLDGDKETEIVLNRSGKDSVDADYSDAMEKLQEIVYAAAQCSTVEEALNRVTEFKNDFISVADVAVYRNGKVVTSGKLEQGDRIEGSTDHGSDFIVYVTMSK